MLHKTPPLSLTEYLADALQVDLENFMLRNYDAASNIQKQEKELTERRIEHLVQARLSSLLLHGDREKLLRLLRLADPPSAIAAGK